MIKVNLLPAEYRKVERTPVLRFVTIICGVVLSASAIGAFLYVHFGMLVEVVSEREKVQETHVTKKVLADRSMDLQREASEYQKRRDYIEAIGQNRKLWSKQVDELCDVLHNKGDRKRHLVWLNQIRSLGPTKDSDGGVYIKGYSGGSEIHRLSDFHLDLKNSEFFAEYQMIDNPEGSVVKFTDGRLPDTAWEFDFNMRMKPLNPKK
jgi:Tfp pilus assembly protein PilN